MWVDLKKWTVHAIFYYSTGQDTHTTQDFNCLEQGLDEFLDNYLHYVSDLLLKIYHASDMSRISAEDTNCYAIVYRLKCWKLKDSMAAHKSVQWNIIQESFRDIQNIAVEY